VLLPLCVLAVPVQRRLRLLVELGQWPAYRALLGELEAGASTGAQHEGIGDAAESGQAGDPFGQEVDLLVAGDFADAG
jgi:hypothetical protein